MKPLLILLLALSLLYSCHQRVGEGSWIKTEDSIAIDPALLNAKCSVKTDAGSGTLFQGYNKETNELVLIDLDSAKTILTVRPAIDFEKAGRLVQFDIYKADSIFIITEDYVFIVDAGGQVVYSRDLSTPPKDEKGEAFLLWDNDNQFPLHYNSKTKELLVKTICHCSYMEPEYFKHKLEGWLHLETGAIRQADYSFPSNHYQHAYAQSVFSYRIFKDSLSIVSFQSQDSLYVYNHHTGSLKSHSGKSQYQSIDFIPFDTAHKDDMERVKEYLIVNPIYQRILYDPYRQLYYRFFVKEQPLKKENGVYNTIFSKEVILMVFNQDFQLIAEKNIGSNYSWYFSFVSPRGLYIRKYDTSAQKHKQNYYARFTVFSWN